MNSAYKQHPIGSEITIMIFNGTKYIVKMINKEWRYREYMTNNGWKFVRLATVDNPALANKLLETIEGMQC